MSCPTAVLLTRTRPRRGPPRRASAYEIFTGFHVDFGFQNGFLDFTVDFWISVWISADGIRDFFRDGPLDSTNTLHVWIQFHGALSARNAHITVFVLGELSEPLASSPGPGGEGLGTS